ncbi:MAG: cytochrome c biogenesis protein CcsA [Verrucomicrobiales bacterium]|jgi:ABC-type transport system involved in cytochrome c biogenesis permease subunit|nr:cytochrome c biogenesis protein CcsA [Verrucomicrobiales bacterium]
MKKLLTTFFALGIFGFSAVDLNAQTPPKSSLQNYVPWSEETVHTFENLLVQQDGRVKPLYTVARFTLLQFSGKSTVSFQTQDGEKHRIHYAAWLLDVLFRGDLAKEIPVFIVDDSAAVVEIGVSPKSKRDRYSYSELFPGRAKLAELGAQYAEKQQKYEKSEKDKQYELGRVEGMILTLGRNISSFEYLVGQFGFARKGEMLVNENILPPELTELAKRLDTSEMIDKMPEMSLDQLVQTVRQTPGDSEEERMFSGALRLFFFHANSARGLNIFPPQQKDNEVWLSAGDLMLAGLASKGERPWVREQLSTIQTLVNALKEGEGPFLKALQSFRTSQDAIAESRGEGIHSELEVTLYRGKWFTYSLYCFVFSFVLLAFSWLSPGSKAGKTLVLITCLVTVIGLALDIYGVTLRSIIRQRPPITNLYDTVLFITGIAVLLGLLLEYFTRVGIGVLVAVFAGVVGMFLSMKYEAKEATDTITQLVAVLDTNFWLATHVTIINIGYAAGLVSAIIALIYLPAKLIGTLRGKPNKEFYRTLTRMNYGVICFCLFFSLVGTVLGGIWANYSWGRFWGWDPKENGALMICLWSLVILHGRMAGWIREIGLHMNSLILAMLVTFSWWGVNNLGVGLHSYGFTEGVWGALFGSWSVLGVFMLMGVISWIMERTSSREGLQPESSPKAATS